VSRNRFRAFKPASGCASPSNLLQREDTVDAEQSKRMSQQPESPSSMLTASPAQLSGTPIESAAGDRPPSATHPRHRAPHWLERTELFLRVMLRMYIGLALCYLPWSHSLWDQNPLFLVFPALGSLATAGAMRGFVSGLGLLNLWIAFHDAMRHRDN